jgi:hydrogenase maturation protease
MNASPRILVAGIGNIFLGDDAFGCEVVRELSQHPLADGVRVVDFGIRGYDLAYALMDDYHAFILVDAVPRGHEPGTLFLIEPDLNNLAANQAPEGHSMNPVSVLQLVRSLGGEPHGIYLVGCEPSVLESEDGQMGLSESVQNSVPRAVELIEKLISDLVGKIDSIKPPSSLVETI